MLEVKGLSISFGGLKAVDNLSFTVKEGEIHGLIGPNGAGKTTVFNCISRFYTPDEGAIHFREKNILKDKVHEVIQHGIVRTFQNVELIKHMTVMDNLLIGLHHQMNTRLWEEALGLSGKKEKAFLEKGREILDFLGLGALENAIAGAQPYGVQKLIELGRTLITRPPLIILDEPAAGMNHQETEALASLIRRIRDELGTTILLVEHDMDLVMGICDHITVLSFGEKIASGDPAFVREHPEVQKAYLGGEELD